MADYLYASNPDSAYEPNDGDGKWANSATGFHPSGSPDPSAMSHNISSWTAQSRGPSTVFSAASLYDPEPDLSELLSENGGESNQSHARKTQLSHSRSFPGLHQNYSQEDLSPFRTAASLEIPQPGEFTAYSFESNTNPSSSLFSPSNLVPQQFMPQDNYHQAQQRIRTPSNGSLASAGLGTSLRCRSESEGSSSWAGLSTPMTPGDMSLQNAGYKADFGSYGGPDFAQHNNHMRLNPSDLGISEHPASAPIQDSSGMYSLSSQNDSSTAGEAGDMLQPHSAQHAYASSVFQAPPTLQNVVRHASAGRRLQPDHESPAGRHRSPLVLDPGSLQTHGSGSPNRGLQHNQSMSSRPPYSRSASIESSIMARNRSLSATPAEMVEQTQRWSHPSLSSSLPLSTHMGQQFATLHIEGQGQMAGAFMPPKNTMSRPEREALLAPFIRLYLSSTNRFLLGERTVLVLSGRVAQKSYGTEKRFLCPPPSALLLGCSWWAAAEADPRRPMPIPNRLALHPPTTIISMSGEHSIPTEAYAEWMSMSGHVVGDQASLEDVVIAGRCVGKQLHISEVDEKTKKVEALVRVIAPGFGPPDARHIGTFPSKPIKVISKPSKKRQSIKNLDLCIHHGTTIALFNRLRSQTVSTKYLCVSGPSASFPAGDWRAMSGMEEKPFAPAEDATCFVARTSAWDPFIIYLVDPSKPTSVADNNNPSCPPLPGYPRAPSNALPLSPNGCPIPIYYNQPIVLQCLSTAVVSPVMVIRKVDKGSTATGGASMEGSGSSSQRDMPVAPGEVPGDPVSQLHKVALEVMTDPLAAYTAPNLSALAGFPGSGSFLACLGENVGVHRAESGRQPVPPPKTPPRQPVAPLMTPPSSASSIKSFGSTHQDALAEATYLSSQLTQPLPPATNLRSRSLTPQSALDLDFGSADGGKVKRNRKVSSSMLNGRSAQKPRKRAGSISSSGGFDDMGSESSDGNGNHPHPLYPHASKVWTIECGEPAVWTIVGCDVERHTFWMPPVLINGKPSSPVSPGTVSDVFTTPIPSQPIGYDSATPIPVIVKYLPPNPASVDPHDLKMITIYGANLSPHLHVWFGDVPSPHVEFKCAEVVMAQPPPQMMEGQSLPSCQIILITDEGIVFPSKVYFTGF